MIKSLLDMIAPSCCKKCGASGRVLCIGCIDDSFFDAPEVCALCNKMSPNSKTCTNCRRKFFANNLMYISSYKDLVKDLIFDMKLSADREVARFFAEVLDTHLPYFEFDLVTYVPASSAKLRVRGFDHAKLTADSLARKRNKPLVSLLTRVNNIEQKRLTFQQRKRLIFKSFKAKTRNDLRGKTILLIDDVVSTGYTMAACAKQIKGLGAKRVYVAVVARNFLS